VIEGEQLELAYVARDRASTTRIVHPLGLAAKGSVWYLVADTEAGLRTFRVDRVNFEAAQADLRRRGISVEFQDHGAAHSIYFKDPDGLQLELTTYEL